MGIQSDLVQLTANEFDTTVTYMGRLISVNITSISTGTSANGHALCSPEDKYNAEFGFALAYQRALHRLVGKGIKHLVRGAEEYVEAINSGQSI